MSSVERVGRRQLVREEARIGAVFLNRNGRRGSLRSSLFIGVEVGVVAVVSVIGARCVRQVVVGKKRVGSLGYSCSK